jgi:hypothetical protein
MKIQSKALFAGILLAALSPFALATFQAEPAKSDGSVTPTPTLNAAAAEPAAAPTAPPVPETPLHEVDAVPVAPTNPAPLEKPKPARHRHHEDDGDNRVTINDETVVGPNDTVEGNAVSIMGPLTVDGTVEENGVSVMGRSTINGTVHGNAVAVLGNLRLGPNARVDGNAVSVGGRVIKDPNASAATSSRSTSGPTSTTTGWRPRSGGTASGWGARWPTAPTCISSGSRTSASWPSIFCSRFFFQTGSGSAPTRWLFALASPF